MKTAARKKTCDWHKSMTFSQSVRTCLKKYSVFSGRASRSEYWWFVLFLVICNVLVPNSIRFLNPDLVDVFSGIIYLVLLLPWIAVATRRLHDTGRSGWLQLIPIVVIIWLVEDTEKSDNKYGPYENPT